MTALCGHCPHGPARVGGVGGQRGPEQPSLFCPPLPKRSVRLSPHCAFQHLTTTALCCRWPRKSSALGISPTGISPGRMYLPPFPMYTALPCAEYYGGSVALCLAARRAIPHSHDAGRLERDVGAVSVSLSRVTPDRPARGSFGRPQVSRPIVLALASDALPEDGCLHRWRLRFRQYGFHPIARVLHDVALRVFRPLAL